MATLVTGTKFFTGWQPRFLNSDGRIASAPQGVIGTQPPAGMRRTPLAWPVVAHAERVPQDARRMRAGLQAHRCGATGRVRIGALHLAAAAPVPAAVLRLREPAPGIERSVVQDIAAAPWSRFERDALELPVTRLDAPALRSGMPQRRLFRDRHRVVCLPGHPLAGRKRATWRGEARFRRLMPPVGTRLYKALSAGFAAAGVALPQSMPSSTATAADADLLTMCDAIGALSPRRDRGLAGSAAAGGAAAEADARPR